MSYCRWSSDNYNCDLYVYEHVGGGFQTHVAGRRYTNGPGSEMTPIGLPHDGEEFMDADAGACADRLESLRTMGYVVPQYAIDMLREEAKEAKP